MSPATKSMRSSSSGSVIWATRRGSRPEVEAHHRDAFPRELADGPGADAAERARDEEPLAVRAVGTVHAAVPVAVSNRHTFSRTPMRSISTDTRSPSARNRGGLRNTPTPDGVPVATMSPGSSVNAIEQ